MPPRSQHTRYRVQATAMPLHDPSPTASPPALASPQSLLLRAVAAASQLLVTAADGATVGQALALLGEAVEVDRVYIFENGADPISGEPICSQRFEWARDSITVQIDNPVLQNVRYAETVPSWYPRLSAGHAFAGLVRELPAAERPLLEAQQIISILVVPVVLQDEFWGFVGFDDCGRERRWSADEQAILQAAAASFGGAIGRLRVESALRRREEQYRLVVENVQEIIFQLDNGGRLLFLNPAWQTITGYAVAESLGLPMVEFLHPADREAFAGTLAELSGEAGPSCRLEARCLARDGGERWVGLHIHHVSASSGAKATIFGTLTDITIRKRYEAQIEQLAYFDPLTGLCNRRLLQLRARAAFDGAGRQGRRPTLLYMDLDRFKIVNDTLGHNAGDALLNQVAARLGVYASGEDTLARLGGDEFALLIADGGAERATTIARAILDTLAQPFLIFGHTIHVGGSIGIACYPDDGVRMDDLMKHADIAMYRAKGAGVGFRRYSTALAFYTHERLRTEAELRHAIGAGTLTLHYQPILDLASGAVHCFEALLRWRHPERGLLHPDAFIPLAEESDLIQLLDRWVIRSATRQAYAWKAAGRPRSVAVNLSARSLQDAEMLSHFKHCLAESHGVAPLLIVELTETAVMRDPLASHAAMRQLQQQGLRIAVDDFGSGYTSLSYLKQLPVDVLKVDKSFVQGVTSEAKDAGVVEALISLGRGLGLRVAAEGVETAEQLAWVRGAGCDLAQGYYIGRPAPPDGDETLR